MGKVICVYSSSSSSIDKVYFEAANELGKLMAQSGHTLIYGGGVTGLMGASAMAVTKHNGVVIGVIPKALNVKGIVYENCNELIETEGMRERKAIMDHRADAFIALPGGYGTLEELLEIITLKQLKYHNKPIVILNINGFYENMLKQFEDIITNNFAKKECRKLYYICDNVTDAILHIENYEPFYYTGRWLTDVEI